MPDESLRQHLPRALKIVWLIIGFVSGFLILAPFVFPADSLFGLFPVCAAKAAGGRCLLCGMTTAFVHVGEGDLIAARQANGGSLLLYAALTLNFGAALAYTMMRVIRHANS